MDPELAQLQRETRSSIELKRNAKGEYAWDVKLYFDEGTTVEREMILIELDAIDQSLRATYLGKPEKEGV